MSVLSRFSTYEHTFGPIPAIRMRPVECSASDILVKLVSRELSCRHTATDAQSRDTSFCTSLRQIQATVNAELTESLLPLDRNLYTLDLSL